MSGREDTQAWTSHMEEGAFINSDSSSSSTSTRVSSPATATTPGSSSRGADTEPADNLPCATQRGSLSVATGFPLFATGNAASPFAAIRRTSSTRAAVPQAVTHASPETRQLTDLDIADAQAIDSTNNSNSGHCHACGRDVEREAWMAHQRSEEHQQRLREIDDYGVSDGGGLAGQPVHSSSHPQITVVRRAQSNASDDPLLPPPSQTSASAPAEGRAEDENEETGRPVRLAETARGEAELPARSGRQGTDEVVQRRRFHVASELPASPYPDSSSTSTVEEEEEEENEKSGAADSDYSDDFEHEDGPYDEDCVVASGSSLRATSHQQPRLADGLPDSLPAAATAQTSAASYNIPPASTTPLPSLGTASLNDLASVPSAGHVSASPAAADRTEEVQVRHAQLSDEQQERRRARVLETQLNAYLYEKERELLAACLRRWYAVMFVRATSEAKATKEMTREPTRVQAPPLRSSSPPPTSAHIDPTLTTITSAVAAVAEKSRSSQSSQEQPRSGPTPSPATPASQPTSARQTEERRPSHASAAATPLIAADAGPSPLFTSQVKSYARVHVTPDGRITSTRAPRQAKSDTDGGSADTPSCAASSSSLESEGQELEVMHTDVRWVMVPSQRAESSASSSTSSISDGVYEPLRRTGEQLASVVRTALQRESASATPRGTPCSEHMSPAPSHHVYHTLDPTRQPPRRQTLPSLPSDEALRQPAGAATHGSSSGFFATTPLSPPFGQTAVEGVRDAAVTPVERPKPADACNANTQDDTQERRPGLMGVVVDHEDVREYAKVDRDKPATAGDGAAAAAHALTVATPPSSHSSPHQWEGDEEEDVRDHPASTPSSPSRSKEPKSPTQSASAWESAVDDPAEGGGNMEAVRAAALQGDGGCPLPHDVVRPPSFPPASSACRPSDERETVKIEAPAWMMGVEGEEDAVVKEETTTALAPSTPIPSSTDDFANSMGGREEERDPPEQQPAARRSPSPSLPPTEDEEEEEVAEDEVDGDAAVNPHVGPPADGPVAAAAARLNEVEEVLSYPLEASRRESAALPAAPQPTNAACSSAGGVEAGDVEEAEENPKEGEKDSAAAAAHRTTLTDVGPNTDLTLPQQASADDSRSRATSYSEDFIPTAQSSASSAVVLQSSQASGASPVNEPVPCVEEKEEEEEEVVVVEAQETAVKTPHPAFHYAPSSSSTSTIIVVAAAQPSSLSVAVEPLETPHEVALLAPSPPPAAQSPRPSSPSQSYQQEEPQPQPSASLPSTSRSRTSRSLLSYSQGPSSQPAVDEEYKKACEVNTEEEEGRSETSWTSRLQQQQQQRQQQQQPQQHPQTPLRNDGGSEVPEMPARPTTSEESHAEAENQAAVEAPVDSPAPPQAHTADNSRHRRRHPVPIRRGRLHRALLGLHARKTGISSSSSSASNVTTHTQSDIHDDDDDAAAAAVPSPDNTVTPNVVVEEDEQEKEKEAAQDVAEASLHPYADLAGTPASLVRHREKNGFEATWLLRRALQQPAGTGGAPSAGGTGLHRTADDDDVAGLPESERYDNAAGEEWVRCLAHLANVGGSGVEQQPTPLTDALLSSPVKTQEAAESEPAVEVGEAVPIEETSPSRDAAAHLSTVDSPPLANVPDDCVAAYTEDDVVESEADFVSSAQLKSSSEPLVTPAAEAASQAVSEEVPEEEEEGDVDEAHAEVDSTPSSHSSQAAQPLSGSTSASITSSASVSMNAGEAEERISTHSAQKKPHAEEAVLADAASDQSSMRGATASTPLPPPVAPVEEAFPLPAEVPQPLTPPPPSPSPPASSSASSPELSNNNSVTAAAVVSEASENARTVVLPTSAGDAVADAAPPPPRRPSPPSTPQQEPLPSVRVDALDDAQPRGEQTGSPALETVGAAAEQALVEPARSSSREEEEVSEPATAADAVVVISSTRDTEDQAAKAQDGAGEPHVLRDSFENKSETAVIPTSDATARKVEAAGAQVEVQGGESAARTKSSTALATPPPRAVSRTPPTPCAGSVSEVVAAETHTAPSESSGSGLPSLHVPAMCSQGDCVASAAPSQPLVRHQDVRRRPSTVEPAVAPVPALNHRPSALSMTSGSGGGTSAPPPDNTLPHTTCGEMLPEPHHHPKPCDVNSDKQRMSTGVHTPASSALPHDGASVASLPESAMMWGSAAAASWQRRGQPQPQPQPQQQQRLLTTPPVPIAAAAAFYHRRRPSRTPRLSEVASSSSSSSVEDASPSPAEDHYLSLRSERRTPREGTQPPPRVTLATPQQRSVPASQEPQRAALLPAAAAAGEPSALGVQPTTHPYCYRDLMHNAAGVMQKGEVVPPPSSSAALAAGAEQAKGLVTSRVDDEGGRADAALESPEALTAAAAAAAAAAAGNGEAEQRAAVQNGAAAAAGVADPSSPSISSSSAASHRHRHSSRSAHAKRPKEETPRVQETEAGVESVGSPKDGLASPRPGTAAVSGNSMVPAVVPINREKDMVVDTAEGEQHRGEERRRRHSNHHHSHRRRASHDASPTAPADAAQSGVENRSHPSAESPRRHHRSRSHHRHGSRRRTSSSRDPQREHRSVSAAPLHSLQPHSTSQRHQLTSPVAARGGRCDADLRNTKYVGQEGLLSPTVASLHPQPAFVHHHPYELQAVRRPLLTAPQRDRVGAAAKGDAGAAKAVGERPPAARLHARVHQHRHRSPSSSSTTPSFSKGPSSAAAGKGDFALSPVPSTVQDGALLHTGGAAAETAQTVEPLAAVDSQPTPPAEQQDSGHNTADVAALSDTREEKEAKAVAPQTRDAEDCLLKQQQQQQQPSRQTLSSAEEQPEEVTLTSLDDRHAKRSSHHHHHHRRRRRSQQAFAAAADAESGGVAIRREESEPSALVSSPSGIVAPYSAPGKDADEHRRRRHRSRHRDVVAADKTPPGVPHRFPVDAVVPHASASAAEPGELFYRDNNGDYHRIDDDEELRDFLAASAASPHRAAPLYVVHNPQRRTPSPSRDNARVLPRRVWTITDPKNPLGCSRLNPYCATCRSRYNLIFVDADMRPLRWPSPHSAEVAQMGDCRVHSGYVFSGNGDRYEKREATLSRARERALYTQAWPERPHVPPGQLLVWEAEERARPLRQLTPPPHGRFMPVTYDTHGATTPPPLPAPRRSHSEAYPQHYQQQQQQQRRHASLKPAREAEAEPRQVYMRSATSATTTTTSANTERRASQQRAQHRRRDVDDAHPYAPSSASASAKVAAEEHQKKQKASGSGGDDADVRRREERRIRRALKQLLWRDLPEQRGTPEWERYMRALSKELCEPPLL